MEYNVIHNQAEQRFEVHENGYMGYVEYNIRPEVLEITHTIVPEALEGRGVAAALNRKVLDYAREAGLKVMPFCSYTQLYLIRHPEYNDLRF